MHTDPLFVYTHILKHTHMCVLHTYVTANHSAMERANLVSVMKLCVKALIETAMKQGKALHDDHPQLVQLLVVMELVLKHRLKGEGRGLDVTCAD